MKRPPKTPDGFNRRVLTMPNKGKVGQDGTDKNCSYRVTFRTHYGTL